MYKKITTGIIISLLYNNYSYAQSAPVMPDVCPNPVTYVTINTPVKCTGYLFSPEMEQKLRLEDEAYQFNLKSIKIKNNQLDEYKQEVEDLKKAEQEQEEKSKLWQKQAEESTAKYIDVEERQGWRDLLFLGLGIVLTVTGAGIFVQAAKGMGGLIAW